MKFRNKCEYGFKNGRESDQDELLGFMRSHITPKEEPLLKTPVVRNAAPKPTAKPKTVRHDELEKVDLDDEMGKFDLDDEPGKVHLDDSYDWEMNGQISSEDESSKLGTLTCDVNNDFDPFSFAIRNSFNKVPKEKQFEAMMHVCEKLNKFKFARENN